MKKKIAFLLCFIFALTSSYGQAKKYDYTDTLSEGLAYVKINEGKFYINKKRICVEDCENAPDDHP